jgi:hypothetical protein
MGMKSRICDTGVLQLGDNQYETGSLTIAAGAEIPEGACLKRNTDGTFALAIVTTGDTPVYDVPVAICPSYFKNEGMSSAVIGFRAIIAGRVRRDKITYNGAAITDSVADQLRDYGIIAVTVNDVSRLDNM